MPNPNVISNYQLNVYNVYNVLVKLTTTEVIMKVPRDGNQRKLNRLS